MSNFIRSIEIENRSLDPASAEVWVTVALTNPSSTGEIRGKLMGPHCPYSNTVEIAYPLRSVRPEQQVPGAIRLRASIPEASLWDPQSPFLYTVLLELWEDGQRLQQERLSHGLRAFALTPKGIVVNGKVFRVNGRWLNGTLQPDNGMAARLRQEGVNLLVAPITSPEWWHLADVYGFLLLGQVTDADERTLSAMRELSRRPSCLAWLARPELLPRLLEWTPDVWLASEWDGNPLTIEPRFVVGPESARASNRPLLLDARHARDPNPQPGDLGFAR